MGNAVGNLPEYWNEIYSNPRMLGGFIWEWCDQGLHQRTAEGKTFTAFGGDFGDVPNHGGFAIKGLVSAEREPFPKYWEVKKVYQPVLVEAVNLKPGNVAVKITNRNAFLNLSEYEVHWSVTAITGELLQSGILNQTPCAPGKSCMVKIPQVSAGAWLRVSFHTKADSLWAKAGHEIAWQQFTLDSNDAREHTSSPATAGQLNLSETGEAAIISGTNFSVTFSRTAGTLRSLIFNGREMLANLAQASRLPAADETSALPSDPVAQLFRAPTDNDKGFGKWLARDWREAGLTNLLRQVDSFTVERTKPDAVRVTTVARSSGTRGGYRLKTCWTIRGDGTLDMENEFVPFGELPQLPRVGLVLGLAKDLENVRWLGRGPWENYSDRKASTDLGVWASTVTDQYVPYVRPQETGNKEDVRWVELTDANGRGVRIATREQPMAFSALHFTAADLAAVRHNYELSPRPEVILSIDAKMSGLGNSSCGPGVLERFAVRPENYRLHLFFSPVTPK
jgi:beta-galactosidase